MARAAAVTRTASPAAPATIEKATVRAARSGAAARMIRTRPAGPAAWAPPPWTFPLPGEVPLPWPLTWASAAPASAVGGSTAVTAWTGLTMPRPVPGPAGPSAVAVIRATT